MVAALGCGGSRDTLDLNIGDTASVPRSDGAVLVTIHEMEVVSARPVGDERAVSVLFRATIAVPEGSRAIPFQGAYRFEGTVALPGGRHTDSGILASEPEAPDPRLPSVDPLSSGEAITGWVVLSGQVPANSSEVWVSYVAPDADDAGASWRLPPVP